MIKKRNHPVYSERNPVSPVYSVLFGEMADKRAAFFAQGPGHAQACALELIQRRCRRHRVRRWGQRRVVSLFVAANLVFFCQRAGDDAGHFTGLQLAAGRMLAVIFQVEADWRELRANDIPE